MGMHKMKMSCDRSIAELERIVTESHAFFESHRIDESIVPVIDFAIEEMFVNMVKYNTETTSAIEISIATVDEGVRVVMVDRNVDRFDPTERAPVDTELPAEKRKPGGLGVFLTLKLVDSFSYDYRGRTSTITFTKRREERDV